MQRFEASIPWIWSMAPLSAPRERRVRPNLSRAIRRQALSDPARRDGVVPFRAGTPAARIFALTAHGEDQARSLRPRVAGDPIRPRVHQPARAGRAVHASWACLAVSAEIEPDLAEWDYGAYEGMLSSDIRRERPGWNVYRDGCPGGESAGEVAARADRLIRRLLALRGDVALFSPWAVRLQPGGPLDRAACDGWAAPATRPGVVRRSRLQPEPSRTAGHRPVEHDRGRLGKSDPVPWRTGRATPHRLTTEASSDMMMVAR